MLRSVNVTTLPKLILIKKKKKKNKQSNLTRKIILYISGSANEVV